MECDNDALHDPRTGGGYYHALPDTGMAAAVLDAYQAHFCSLAANLSFHLPECDEPDAEGHFQMELDQAAGLERGGYDIFIRNSFPGGT